ncbi:MAG TPA: ADP-ribosylglycohydrolase family protein [Planctomycetota bacterium]|jgi:ADP-ribosylglycohydrolase
MDSIPSFRDRIVGGVLGLAVGDALGVPVEFRSRDDLVREPVHDMSGPGTHHQPPGTWSDDSSLALATLDSLLGGYDPADMMKRFCRWRYQHYMTARGSVFDCGITTHMAITRYRDGAPQGDWGGEAEAENGNGSLMRILPLSLYVHRSDPNTIVERSGEVSALTHAHIRSKLCCGYFSLLIKAILSGQPLHDAIRWAGQELGPHVPALEKPILQDVLSGEVTRRDRDAIDSGGYVVHTLEASLWCVARCTDFSAAVLAAVNLGGDTDTTGAVTGALAGVLHGQQAIPEKWRRAIARADDVQALAHALADRIEGDASSESP